MLYIFRKNKEEVLAMTLKGGSKLYNDSLHWTLLQCCFYYMVMINDPFMEYRIDFVDTVYSCSIWPYVNIFLYFVENLFYGKSVHPIDRI